MTEVNGPRTLQTARANWVRWENKFRRISADVIDGRYSFHTAKCVLFLVAFAALHFASTGQLPSFQQLSFIKLVLFSMLFEALGLGCSSGPLGGHTGSDAMRFPLFWHNTHVGTCKLPSFAYFSKTRDSFHIAAFLAFISTLLFLLCTATPDSTEPRNDILELEFDNEPSLDSFHLTTLKHRNMKS